MKKIISLLGVITILFTMSVQVFAGDIPETLLSYDDAKLFIGTVENFTTKEVEGSSQAYIETVEVTPTEKIKGEVKVGIKETYTRCDSVLDLKNGEEYLFGYIDENNFYIYEIKSRDEKNIKLVDSDKYDMTKRLEDYLNEGAFAMAEQERSTLGEQISFAEFLYTKPLSDSNVVKVILRYQDELHEVDKDEFEKIAQEIMITNVKDDLIYETDQEGAYKTVLYVELLDANGQVVSFGAVSRFGEVDRYGLAMSRLMAKDYEMKTEDISKLYSLFPDDVQKDIIAPEGLPSPDDTPLELPDSPKKNYAGWIAGGIVGGFVLAFVIGFTVIKKKGTSK